MACCRLSLLLLAAAQFALPAAASVVTHTAKAVWDMWKKWEPGADGPGGINSIHAHEDDGPFAWWLGQLKEHYADDNSKSVPRCSRGRWSHKVKQEILPLVEGSEWANVQEQARPSRPSLLAHPDDGVVFVGLAAYRDGVRCGATLFEAFTKAWNPARVVLGVVDQLAAGDPACLDIYCQMMADHGAAPEAWARRANFPGAAAVAACPFKEQVRVSKQAASESKGPCLSRSQQADLIAPTDEFCMSMDAHMKLTPYWDRRSVVQWLQTANEHAVLSHYPKGFEQYYEHVSGLSIPTNCIQDWQAENAQRTPRTSDEQECNNLVEPKMNVLWGAGYSFAKCHAERRAPMDPKLLHIFDGEEVSHALRLWTHGYDLYTPSRQVVFHDYSANPRAWVVSARQSLSEAQIAKVEEEKAQGFKRFRQIWRMDGEKGATPAGERPHLGSQRTLEQWEAFSNVSPRHHTLSGDGMQCGNGVHWVQPSRIEQMEEQERGAAAAGAHTAGSTVPLDAAAAAVGAVRTSASAAKWDWEKIAPELAGIKAGFAAHKAKECESCKGPPKPRGRKATCFMLDTDKDCCSADDERPEFAGPCVPVRGKWAHTCEPKSFMVGMRNNPAFVRVGGKLADCDAINANGGVDPELAKANNKEVAAAGGGAGGGGAFGRRQGVKTALLDAADQAFEDKNDRYLLNHPA